MNRISDVIKELQAHKKRVGNLYVQSWMLSDENMKQESHVLSKARVDGNGYRKRATVKEFSVMVKEEKK